MELCDKVNTLDVVTLSFRSCEISLEMCRTGSSCCMIGSYTSKTKIAIDRSGCTWKIDGPKKGSCHDLTNIILEVYSGRS